MGYGIFGECYKVCVDAFATDFTDYTDFSADGLKSLLATDSQIILNPLHPWMYKDVLINIKSVHLWLMATTD
ncbi:hypothetical protein [Flavobacterium sp. PLA-1-15]|uniref:hypothetical protein n=1 Tax=Flavobacterium sp. PLA-1-15 TaxID=3380533 RepID=UPI003B97EFDA